MSRSVSYVKKTDIETLKLAANTIDKARHSADDVISNANEEAKLIIDAAFEKAEEILRDAHNRAKNEYTNLLNIERQRAQQKADEEAFQLVMALRKSIAASEQKFSDLVIEAVERIIGQFEPTERVHKTIQTGLREFSNQQGLILRVHPENFSLGKAIASCINDDYGQWGPISAVHCDEGLAPSACVLESASGTIDVSVERQIECLKRSISVGGKD